MGKIVDSSFVHEDPTVVAAHGYESMARYLSVDNASTHAKIITPAEAQAIHAAGLGLVLAYEYGATSDSWNGDVARAEADAISWPADRPIYWTEDRYVAPAWYPTVGARLDMHGNRSGRPRGLYGPAQLVQAMLDQGHAQFGWIAGALSWSHAATIDDAIAAAPGAHLAQLVGSPLAGTDENLILKPDYGQSPNQGAPMFSPDQEKLILDAATRVLEMTDPNPAGTGQLVNIEAALDRIQKALGAAGLHPDGAALSPDALADAVVARLAGQLSKQ